MGGIGPFEAFFLLALIAIAALFIMGITNAILKHRSKRGPINNMLTEGELESMIERAVDRSIAPLRESVTRSLQAPAQSPPEEVHETKEE